MTAAPDPLDTTVIIPAHDAADVLPRAIDSVFAQQTPPRDIIVVDDGSEDGTYDVAAHALEAALPGTRTEVVRLPENRGPGSARNAGWARATTRYVSFLDADDTWHPAKLRMTKKVLGTDPAIAMVGHAAVVTGEPDPTLPEHDLPTRTPGRLAMLHRNGFSTPTVTLQRTVAHRFEPSLRRGEDHHLWMTLACTGHKIVFIDLALTRLHKPRYGASGLSGDLTAMQAGERRAYRLLYEAGHIRAFEHAWLARWSEFKHRRRVRLTHQARSITRPKETHP